MIFQVNKENDYAFCVTHENKYIQNEYGQISFFSLELLFKNWTGKCIKLISGPLDIHLTPILEFNDEIPIKEQYPEYFI